MPDMNMDDPRVTAFTWDPDPYVFIFHQEIVGKVKMMTNRMKMEDWVQINDSYVAQMDDRNRLLAEIRDKVFVTNHEASTELAKQELLDLLVDYLPDRFPDKFERREGGIYNRVLNEFISNDPNASLEEHDDPLVRCGKLTQEDWCVMEWSEEKQAYCLTAGVLYFPMRWDLNEKWNQPMSGIHQPVKPFTEHLQAKVYDLFKKMTPTNPIWRANWAVFNDLDSPMDLYSPTGHLERQEVQKLSVYEGEKTGHDLTFRVEYQTLRKLPKSNAIIFSIRTYQRYLEEFKTLPKEDTVALIKSIVNLLPDFRVYKSAEFWEEAALRYLRENVLGEDPPQHVAACGSENHVTKSSAQKYLPYAIAAGAACACIAVAIKRGRVDSV